MQLDANDDGSGLQHWQIIPIPPPPPPPRKPSSPPQLAELPVVSYNIAFTGYIRDSFGASEQTAFCDSILNSTTYPQDWMRCVISVISDVPFRDKSSGRRLMQGSTVYVQGYTAFEFVYGDPTGQQQAQDAADDLYENMNSTDTLQTIFESSFNSSTITPESVNLGELTVPENTLPASFPPPTPSNPTPPSPNINLFPPLAPIFNIPPEAPPAPTPIVPIPGPTVPSPPTNVIIAVNTGALGTVNAAWGPPASNGGAPIISYDIQCTDSATPTPGVVTATGISGLSTTVTGLTPGETYSCSVRATNSVGSSPYSAAVTGLVISTVPGVPAIGVFTAYTGTAGIGTVNAAWTAPATDGGSTIVSYDIECTNVNLGTDVATAPALSATSVCSGGACSSRTAMAGLTLGERYTCKVRATNSVGSSAYSSASDSLLILTIPGLPGTVTASPSYPGNSGVISWSPSNDGGAPIKYNAMCQNTVDINNVLTSSDLDPAIVCTTNCGVSVAGLTDGQQYTCGVQATNSVGSSDYSFSSPFTSGVCFPRMAAVQIHDGTQKYMYQLVPGDRVLSIDSRGQMVYSPIYVLPHAEPHGMYSYLKFTMEAPKTINSTACSPIINLTASPDHYLLLATPAIQSVVELNGNNAPWSTRRAVRAADAKVGDYMWIVNTNKHAPELSRILAIEDILDEGIYAPFTVTGTIVVNGVVASVYNTILGSEYNMHVFCAWGRWLYKIWPQFFIRMHQLNWASPVAMKMGYAMRAVLKMASII